MALYVNKHELIAHVKEYREKKVISTEFLAVLNKIVCGINGRYFPHTNLDVDDIKQEYFLLFLKKQKRIKLRGNIFAYLSQLARNMILSLIRKKVMPTLSEIGYTEGNVTRKSNVNNVNVRFACGGVRNAKVH